MKIGFIGLGRMGFHMALNLIQNDHKVIVFDVNEKKMEKINNHGAELAGNIAAVGNNTSIIFLMVLNYHQIQNIIFNSGLLDRMRPGGIIVINSTISPIDVQRLEKELTSYDIGIVDAPVSGGINGAMNGNLTIMISGKKDLVDKCYPYLSFMGTKILYFGEQVGNGQTVKVLNQFLFSSNLLASVEAVKLAVKLGINVEQLYELIGGSTGQSWAFDEKIKDYITEDTTVKGTLNLLVKDLEILCHLCEENNISSEVLAFINSFYILANKKGLGEKDALSIIEI